MRRLFMVALMLGSVGCASDAPALEPGAAPRGIAVYALSRGQGVPAAASGAYDEIKARLQSLQGSGVVVGLSEQRIGLEGERRLCAVFAQPQAARAEYQRLAHYQSVDLLNVVLESCDDGK